MAQSRCNQIFCFIIQCVALLAITTWPLNNSNASTEPLPNILFILVDDLGWNDVGFHGSCDFSTPNIDNIAINYGLQLNNYYVNSLCTPTRAALLSGRYSIRTGMQHKQLSALDQYGLPLQFTLLSQDLQNSGYDTYLFGKWHLGYFNEQYTPTFRGFNTFYGYYNGMEDFFNHTATFDYNGITYKRYDLMDNTDPVHDPMLHTYSTFIYGNKTLDVLNKYNDNKNTTKQPFFIYLSLQNVHSPLQAPQHVIDSIPIGNGNRKIKAAQATVVDNMIGDIVQLLNDTGLWRNVLIIFSTDNGAASNDGGSNYPLRGTKGTLWEGAVRGTAFISGGYLNTSRYGQVSNELVHVTDFYPTICDIVGINATDSDDFDGISFLNILQNEQQKSQREEVLLNIDPVNCNNSWNICGGIRFGDWKLLIGNDGNQVNNVRTADGVADICVAGWCTNTDFNYYDTALLSTSTTIKCAVIDTTKWNLTNIYGECPFNGEPCLFNIKNDPCEFDDIYYPTMTEYLINRLMFWKKQMVTPLNILNSEADHADIPFNEYWIPWKNASEIIMWNTNNISTTTSTPTIEPTLEPTLNPTVPPISIIKITETTMSFTSEYPTSSSSQMIPVSSSETPTMAPIIHTTSAYPSFSATILSTVQTTTTTNNPTVVPSKIPTHNPISTISPTIEPSLTPTFSPTNSPIVTKVVTEVPSKGKNKYMTSFYLVSIFSICVCGCIICIGICYKKSKNKNALRHSRLEDALRGIELRTIVRPPRSGGEYSGLLN